MRTNRTLPSINRALIEREAFDLFDQKKQVKRVAWRGGEAKMLVESPSVLILGMHHEGTDARDVRCLKRPLHRVL